MDEIDAIGGRRFSEGTSADREIQRTLMELLNQLDGFDYLGKTKVIFATNRVSLNSGLFPLARFLVTDHFRFDHSSSARYPRSRSSSSRTY
jgi:ATP-dependent Zn protease